MYHRFIVLAVFASQVTFLSGPFKDLTSKIYLSLFFKYKSSSIIACSLISAMRGRWKLFFRHCDATENAFELRSNTRQNWSRFGKKSVEMGAKGKCEVYGFIKDVHSKLDENKCFAVWLAWCLTMLQDVNIQSIDIFLLYWLTWYHSLSQKTNCHEEV